MPRSPERALPNGDEWPCGFGGGPTTSVGGPTTSVGGPTTSVGDQPPNVNGFFHRRSPVLPHGVLHRASYHCNPFVSRKGDEMMKEQVLDGWHLFLARLVIEIAG